MKLCNNLIFTSSRVINYFNALIVKRKDIGIMKGREEEFSS